MAFFLRVHFTGLCLFVIDPDTERVAVLMPDARQPVQGDPLSGTPHKTHRDNAPAVPHAGYLRADLASMQLTHQSMARIQSRTLDPCDPLDPGPEVEVVCRLDRHVLDLGIPGDDAVTLDPNMGNVPNATEFAPVLQPIAGLFSATPPRELLFRTILHGGTLVACPGPEKWTVDSRLNGNAAPLVVNMPGGASWVREVTDAELAEMNRGESDPDVLRVTLRAFDGTPKVVLPLRPVDSPHGRLIDLKLANLCAENPLEWNELEIRRVILEDADFKWMYRLLEPPQPQSWDDLLGDQVLPAPRLVTQPRRASVGDPMDCGQMRVSAPIS
jgi:hypothetical protein